MRLFLVSEVIAVVIIISLLLIGITIGKDGYVPYCKLKIQIQKKQIEIQELAIKNYKISKTIESLQNDKSFLIEKIAREELMLVKPGELVYLVRAKD